MKTVLPVELRAGAFGAYRDLAEAFIDFAINTTNSPIHGPGLKNSVYFLGTYWDVPPPKPSAKISPMDHGITLFVNPIISIVSAEEHKGEFPPNPPDKQVMGRAEEIINDTDAEITIREKGGHTIDYSIGQLQRIQVPFRKKKKLTIRKGVWPNFLGGGDVNACWDGYFIAIELDKGNYEIELKADSPYLGKPGHRFSSDVLYELTMT